ncbi:nitrilase-related carbon-nitrogen hydrolase [Streptomyces sp. TRM76323]|uniref:Nitrilase-related carbon-nitrogen hydrolase n=1 Tax=Streptomyces tamarix TaxID=3078565 RepID=A0ABU3QUJ1_9ACTN|nr:nitrilase-related carbon-nitrogen hydrolase [Streptomyces tamarix]MDT9686412.1 nitrilase-related carbon-nitrogen hydrolase [Streptomyces tamarix]
MSNITYPCPNPSETTRRRGEPGEAGPVRDEVQVGFLQFAPQVRSEKENVEFIRSAVRGVTEALVVLPEFFLGSYRAHSRVFSGQGELARQLGPLLAASAEQGISFVGSLPVRSAGNSFNRAVVIESGRVFPVHDKTRLFGAELDVFSRGRASHRIVDIAGLPSTVQICLDIVDPEPARSAAAAGAGLILSPSTVSVEFLRIIHQARALENQVVSVFCNRHGAEEDGTIYLGRSAVFFPDGTEVSAPSDEDALEIRTVRAEQFDRWKAVRRNVLGIRPAGSATGHPA